MLLRLISIATFACAERSRLIDRCPPMMDFERIAERIANELLRDGRSAVATYSR